MTQVEKEFQLSKQILRSGTSIGANSEEAVAAQSKKDFIAKFHIAHKETRETKYWLRLLKDSGYIKNEIARELFSKCDELQRIISFILLTTQQKTLT